MVVGVPLSRTRTRRRSFVTANEIHIPVGKPVRFTLQSADVIHQFWVPRAGRKDRRRSPARPTSTWLEADQPGRLPRPVHAILRQAACAHDPRRVRRSAGLVRERGGRTQLQRRREPEGEGGESGERGCSCAHCAACHTVRGTPRTAMLGPDLTHLMSRSTIAAGTLPNNPGYLSGWIANPQDLKPGALMPRSGHLRVGSRQHPFLPSDAQIGGALDRRRLQSGPTRHRRRLRIADRAIARARPGRRSPGIYGWISLGRPQGGRHPLSRHRLHFPHRRRVRGAGHAAAARPSRRDAC